MNVDATSRDSSPVGLAIGGGALALTTVGYLVPTLDFSLVDSAILFVLYLVGLGFVWVVGGEYRRQLLFVYGLYAAIASFALLAATLYGAGHGTTSPVFMVDRFVPRDDYNLFEGAIRPWIGSPGVSLFGGETNAPLHWFANVRLQEIEVSFNGQPQLMLGNAMNIVIGSITVALIVGCLRLTLRPSTKARFPLGIPIGFVLSCPWLLATSIMALREIWVYAVFAGALYGGLRVSRNTGLSRWIGMGAVAGVSGLLCFLLRVEMTPAVVALALIAALTMRDRPRSRRSELTLVVGIIGVTLLAVVPTLAFRSDSLLQELEARNSEYGLMGEIANEGEQGSVKSLVGNNRVLGTVVQTLWLPVKPLPRILIPIGSTYHLGKLLVGVWLLACGSAVWRVRRLRKRREFPEGRVLRRYRWLCLWVVLMQILVGVTSSESRHFYVVLPVVLCVIGDVFQTRAQDAREISKIWQRSAVFAVTLLVIAFTMTLIVFGLDATFTH